MGKRLSKIYTRTGDDGETGLGDGSRIAKDDARIQAIGSVDELNSYLGMVLEEAKAAAEPALEPLLGFLKTTQHRTFDLGGELSIPGYRIISADHVAAIERSLDDLNQDIPPLENFILPGGSKLIAAFHLARSVCRRAERDVISLSRVAEVNPDGIKFLNRLSDYLFVGARFTAKVTNTDEILWQKG